GRTFSSAGLVIARQLSDLPTAYGEPSSQWDSDNGGKPMNRILLLLASVSLVLLTVIPADAKGGWRSGGGTSGPWTVNVRPYTKRDGPYVGPHHRTPPDSSKQNNWSTKGNVNPYTGKPGMKNP